MNTIRQLTRNIAYNQKHNIHVTWHLCNREQNGQHTFFQKKLSNYSEELLLTNWLVRIVDIPTKKRFTLANVSITMVKEDRIVHNKTRNKQQKQNIHVTWH